MKHVPTKTMFEVRGAAKGNHTRDYCLRRFDNHEAAAAYALTVKMDQWDDIWVQKVEMPGKREITGPPPFPWTIAWIGAYAYIVDATGAKIGTIYGPQKQREFVAEILCSLK